MMQYVKRFFFPAGLLGPTKSINGRKFVAVTRTNQAQDDARSECVEFVFFKLFNVSFSSHSEQTIMMRNEKSLHVRVGVGTRSSYSFVAYCYERRRCVESRGAQNIQNGRRLFMFINKRAMNGAGGGCCDRSRRKVEGKASIDLNGSAQTDSNCFSNPVNY